MFVLIPLATLSDESPSEAPPEGVPGIEPDREPDGAPVPDPVPEVTPGAPEPESEPAPKPETVEPEIDFPMGPGISGPDVMPLEIPPPDRGGEITPLAEYPSPAPLPDLEFATGPARLSDDDGMEHEDEKSGRGRKPARVWPLALIVAVVLGVVALVVTFAYLRDDSTGSVPDLLTLAADRAGQAPLTVPTREPEQAADYIFEQFGWPLEVPDLQAARLEGVGIDPLAEGVELPVLHYRTPANERVTVYAFDYAFLDAAERQVQLAPAVYAHLADPEALDVRRQHSRYLVVWRRRAAIYAAVTPSNDAAQAISEEVRTDGAQADG